VLGGVVVGGIFVASVASLADGVFGYSPSSGSVADTSDIVSTPSSSLLSQQQSVVSEQIKRDAEKCATEEGGLGDAIRKAQKAHETFAWAAPDTSKLFDPNNACFASTSLMWDLSFSIPSWSDIGNALVAAVKEYARKKICTAVNDVVGMVSQPVNQAINQVNSEGGLGSVIGGAMNEVDPALGNSFNMPKADESYTIGAGFSNSELTFGTTTTSGGSNGGGVSASSGSKSSLSESTTTIKDISSKLFNLQQSVPGQLQNVTNTKNAYNACASTGNSCVTEYQNYQQAQSIFNNTESNISTLTSQLQNADKVSSGATSSPSGSPSGLDAGGSRDTTTPTSEGQGSAGSSIFGFSGKE
jgi:hypothetical protein